jgi:hypothetical protein
MGLLRHRLAAVGGLAATCILAVALFVVVVNRPDASRSGSSPSAAASGGASAPPTAASPATPRASGSGSLETGDLPSPSFSLPPLNLPAGWSSTLAPGQISFGPLLAPSAPSGGRLYLAGMDDSRLMLVWWSADGHTWQKVAEPGIDKDFVPRSMVGDGGQGVFIAGELTPSAENVVPQIWHSSDGAGFSRVELEAMQPAPSASIAVTASSDKAVLLPASSAEIVSVDGRPGSFVAFGGHNTTDPSQPTGVEQSLDAWYSADGSDWKHVSLPESESYSAIAMTAWRGGFAALANKYGKTYGVWLSADGATWSRTADVAAFGASGLMSFGDRLVLVGAAQDARWGMVPASFWSIDGKSWTESRAPVEGYAAMFDTATVVGDRIVAIGSSHVGQAVAEGPESGTPAPSPTIALVPPTFWVSSDGASWTRAAEAPAYSPYATCPAAFGGHLVVATAWIGGVMVSVGDLP